MPNFTPGPWIALKDHAGLWVGAQRPDDKERYDIVADIGQFALKEQAEANAQLIAAVPNLYSALQAIVEAGRMSDQPRAQYCSEIAQAALNQIGI